MHARCWRALQAVVRCCPLLACCCAPDRPRPRSPTTTRATSATPTACRSGSTRCGTSGAASTGPGPGGVDALVNARLLLTHSVAAQQGHTGPGAQRPSGAPDRSARSCRRRSSSSARRRTRRAGSQTHVPGWTSSMCNAEAGQHLVFDAEIVDGLVHAWKARRALGLSDETARDDRRPHPPRRVVALLALADDAPQPGQLVRADVRRRRDRHRQPGAAAARPARAARALRRAGRATSAPGLRFQYLPHLAAHAPRQPRLGRVREHRALVPALLQPGAARRDGAAPARGPRPGPALEAARARRLLDARAAT